MKTFTAALSLASALAVPATWAQPADTPSGSAKPQPSKAGKKSRAPKPAGRTPAVPAQASAAASTAPSSAPRAEPRDAAAALAEERARFEALRKTTASLIRLMVEEGVLAKAKAEALLGADGADLLKDVTPKAPAAAPPAPAELPEGETGSKRRRAQTVRVPYVPEVVKSEIRDQIKQEVLAQAKAERWAEPGALPEWLDRITWEGDLRLRYDGIFQSPTNANPDVYNVSEGTNLNNTQEDRHRQRLRVRLGMLARVTHTVGVGLRLASGNIANPVSTNATLGNYQQNYTFNLDRAYLRWDPAPSFTLSGGRMPNPWFYPTDLAWDEDLNFDGLSVTGRTTATGRANGFLTAGAFPLSEVERRPETPNVRNKWMFGTQLGGDLQLQEATRLRVGAGYFHYENIEGIPNTDPLNPTAQNWSRPAFRQKGNSVFDTRFNPSGPPAFSDFGLAARFHVLNFSAELDVARFDPFFIKVGADYIRNIGYNEAEIRARTGLTIPKENDGYQMRVLVGADAIRKRHDWQGFVGYRHVERDATPDAFTDSVFWLGGTNTRGYFVGGFYGLDRNMFVRARWLSGNQISGPPLAIDLFQVDLQTRF